MLRQSVIARALWLLAIALLLVRVGETHLHLCLDGQDRAVTMHVEDSPNDHGSGGHDDRDVDSSVIPWVKKAGAEEMPVVLFAVLVLGLLLPAFKDVPQRRRFILPFLVPLAQLRPPLRGPPL